MCPQVLQTPAQLPLNVHRAQSEAGTFRAAVPGRPRLREPHAFALRTVPGQLACPTQLAGCPPFWVPTPQAPHFSHCCPSWTGSCCPSVPRIQVPAPPSCPRQDLFPISHPREQEWEHPCPYSSMLLSIPPTGGAPTALARLPHSHFPKTGLLSLTGQGHAGTGSPAHTPASLIGWPPGEQSPAQPCTPALLAATPSSSSRSPGLHQGVCTWEETLPESSTSPSCPV